VNFCSFLELCKQKGGSELIEFHSTLTDENVLYDAKRQDDETVIFRFTLTNSLEYIFLPLYFQCDGSSHNFSYSETNCCVLFRFKPEQVQAVYVEQRAQIEARMMEENSRSVRLCAVYFYLFQLSAISFHFS